VKLTSGLVFCGIGAMSLVFIAGYALGQAKAPTQARGVKAVEIGTFDLDGEIDNNSVAGRKLRVRRVTIEPGGATPLHSHAGRPEVTFVIQGSYVVHQEGMPDATRNTGESGGSGNNTRIEHWAENRGTVPAVFLAVDIVPK
jgi:quercetin dioxygenase-like cupin family protein